MKTIKLTLTLIVFTIITGIAFVAQQADSSGANMVSAANGFIETLTADQKRQATFAFDSPERFNWHFIPLQNKKTRKSTRKGLPLEEMTAAQKAAALALLKASTSQSGNIAVATIMSLEAILLEQEGPKSAMVRNPGWYFFTIFGTPSKTGRWGWRLEGHHLSMNFTMEGTQVVSASPCFFGANPAEIKSGPNKGKRILPEAEDFARNLFKSLEEDQKKVAYQPKHFGEPGALLKKPKVGDPVGLAAAKMTKEQKGMLLNLIKSYTGRMPADVAAQELKLVREGGLDKIYFAFTGSPAPGKGFTYRVQGPSFLVEFLNVQPDSGRNPANHIHSCWRRISGDFGL
ncbi:MAG: DUF3500 domain-containing protein [Planctomycetes bacterium]|nr:DUF3500 domain-containing protein [Planctomycetota bacterium]